MGRKLLIQTKLVRNIDSSSRELMTLQREILAKSFAKFTFLNEISPLIKQILMRFYAKKMSK